MCSIAFQGKDKWAAKPVIEMSLDRVIESIVDLGFRGIEVWQPHWEGMHAGQQQRVRDLLQRHQLAVPMLSGYYNFSKSVELARESLAKGHRIIDQAADLGAANIRIFTGNHRSADASQEQWLRVRDCLRELCDHAQALGIGCCLETHDWNLMDTVPGTLRLLELVDRANLGVIFQASTFGPSAWHWALRALKPHVRHVHAPPAAAGLASDRHDFRRQLGDLVEYGFQGFVSLEYMGPEPMLSAVRDGRWLVSCCQQLNATAAQRPSL